MLKLREIVEAAAWVSAHSPTFVEQPPLRDERTLTDFWLLSRQRLHEWTQAVDGHLLRSVAGDGWVRANGRMRLTALISELLAGEVLARVWSAGLTAADRRCGSERYERLVRHVFIGCLHARHRALNLIAEGRQLPCGDLPWLDQLRRRCERWTDVLVGHLVNRYGVEEFAFDPDRAREFGRTQQVHGEVSPRHPVWGLILGGIGVSFPGSAGIPQTRAALSRDLARAALGMLVSAQRDVDCVANRQRPTENHLSAGGDASLTFAPMRRRIASN